ncbi:MAG: TorF family putative porin [Pseudoxanthomonas sp.]
MKPVKLSFALAAALLAMPLASFAQEAAPAAAEEEEASFPLSLSLAATTDYVFRGVSQTDGGPAFQAGLTYSAPFGIYAGVWGSNVDFGTGGFETDYFVGWNTDLSDSWNLDLGVTRYTYSGDKGLSGDYDEVIGKVTWSGPVTLTGLVAYAPDYGDLAPKAKESYASLGASYDIGETGFSLGASVGYTSIDFGEETIEGETFNYGVSDYFDGSVSVSKGFGPATATLGYYDTFGSDADELKDLPGDYYEDRVALTVTIAIP